MDTEVKLKEIICRKGENTKEKLLFDENAHYHPVHWRLETDYFTVKFLGSNF